MSQPPPPIPPPVPSPGKSDELQFDTAEPAITGAGAGNMPPGAPNAVACGICGQPITDFYFAAGDKVVCPQCREQYVLSRMGGSSAGRLVKATVFGLGAGLVGATIWWAVSRFLNMQIGLIAILVGFMVGGAVRAGSGQRGGPAYQLAAVALTYFCIAISYAVQFLEHFLKPEIRGDASMATVLMESLIQGFIYPFARGASGILGLLIIGFALWEAWKMNTPQPQDLAGPYALGGPTDAPPPMPPSSPAPGVR